MLGLLDTAHGTNKTFTKSVWGKRNVSFSLSNLKKKYTEGDK